MIAFLASWSYLSNASISFLYSSSDYCLGFVFGGQSISVNTPNSLGKSKYTLIRLRYSGSFKRKRRDYTIASDYSAKLGSITQSINNLMPPDQAHYYGFPIANFLTISIEGLLYYSSLLSAKATSEFASNLGNVLGATSIHFLINLSACSISYYCIYYCCYYCYWSEFYGIYELDLYSLSKVLAIKIGILY